MAMAIPPMGSCELLCPIQVKNKETPRLPRESEEKYFMKFILVKPAIRDVTSGKMGRARLMIMDAPPHLLKKDSYSASS